MVSSSFSATSVCRHFALYTCSDADCQQAHVMGMRHDKLAQGQEAARACMRGLPLCAISVSFLQWAWYEQEHALPSWDLAVVTWQG